jgi:membrane protein implicated in regulation of membrane protease activity
VSTILANVFLGCFLLGFLLTAASLLFGMDLDGNGGGHSGGPGHGHAGSGHGSMDSTAGGDAGHHGLPWINYNTVVMFMTWFGAAGYLLNSQSRASTLVVLLGAIAAGTTGASLIFLFIERLLLRGETRMNPADYYMPGTLARITSSIREGGTGEIMYVQGGTRKAVGARSDEGRPHVQGEEVVVVRYEKGIAYVRAMEGQPEL